MITKFDLKNSFSKLFGDINYSIVIVFSMAFSLSISLFLYSQIYSIKYKSMGITDSDRIVSITRKESWGTHLTGGIYYYEYLHYAARQTSFEKLAYFEDRLATLATDRFTERVNGIAVNTELFEIADTEAELGRVLDQDDNVHGSAAVAVIGYDLWDRLYDKDPGVLGEQISLNGLVYSVVGVMPQGFEYPLNHEVWVSYPLWEMPEPNTLGWMTLMGKLKPGVSVEQAQDEFNSLSAQLSRDFPDIFTGRDITVRPFTQGFAEQMQSITNIMSVVGIAMLLMGCFSVANLIIVRMLEQSRETLIKTALGVRFSRVITTPLLESFWLCVCAGALGLWLCSIGIKFAGAYLFDGPYWWSVEMNSEIWISAGFFVLFMWLATGVIPIALALKTPAASVLAGGRKGGMSSKSGPLMNALIVLQVVPAFVLMSLTALSLDSLIKTIGADYGVETEERLVADIRLSEFTHAEVIDRHNYYANLSQNLKSSAIVEDVAVSGAIPGFAGNQRSYDSLESSLRTADGFPKIYEIPISYNYFDVVGLELVDGRLFSDSDSLESSPTVIIDERVAESLWPGSVAVGKKILLDPEDSAQIVTVVGVVKKALHGNPLMEEGNNVQGAVYRPTKQFLPVWQTMRLIVKYRGESAEAIDYVKRTARNVDASIAVAGIMTFEQRLNQNAERLVAMAYNFLPASILALIMAAVGIYGITARTVMQKTGDIGIMKALGARDNTITSKFVRITLYLMLTGLACGALVLMWSLPIVTANTTPVSLPSVVTVACIVSLIMIALVCMATYIPLRRINQMPPHIAITYAGNSAMS